MTRTFSQCLARLPCISGNEVFVRPVLLEFRKIRPSYSARSPLIHSYGYAAADDRTDYFSPISPEI